MCYLVLKHLSLKERWIRSIQAHHIWQGREPDSSEELSQAFDQDTAKMTRQRRQAWVESAEGHTIILYTDH